MLTDMLLKMDNTEKEKVHITTLNKCIYLPTFLIIISTPNHYSSNYLMYVLLDFQCSCYYINTAYKVFCLLAG